MTHRPAISLFLLFAALLLPACSSTSASGDGYYWQRVGASEAAFTQGPKAQQLLNGHIASCTAQVEELERLGSLRNGVPRAPDGGHLTENQAIYEGWNLPKRDDNLLLEHSDFHDFESCMLAHGWERVKTVPYDVATRARDSRVQAHVGLRRQHAASSAPSSEQNGDYNN